ncbi:hypothetical protein [Paraflavitalea speifideaquila]|uniref:hypothetical protein n=1 Tax=Paraflavitalea speifideaquila TaxID=3076558 RepID=UPI0028E3D271|nr:hypothetical protein [Paraflavitalea speifideiaquila]
MAPIANSEVWSFRVKQFGVDSNINIVGGPYFSKLTRTEEAAYVISNGILRFEYLHELNEPHVEVSIVDISDAGRKQVQLDSTKIPVQFGQNFQQMDLRQNNDMKNKHMYLLELINARREKWYLKFEYRTP